MLHVVDDYVMALQCNFMPTEFLTKVLDDWMLLLCLRRPTSPHVNTSDVNRQFLLMKELHMTISEMALNYLIFIQLVLKMLLLYGIIPSLCR